MQFLFIVLSLWTSMEACTGILLKANDHSVVHGRTLEFGLKIDLSTVVVPRGHEFVGTTPNGTGLKYKSRYAAVGAIAFDQLAMLDGLNERGLSVGTFYFPGFAGYSEITSSNQPQALSPTEFPNWILTQFATLDEVKAALKEVVIAPTVVKTWGELPQPFHYIVYDAQGRSLVIEPVNGELITYDNPLGILTNSPGFEWHLTNLRNYINLTPYNVKPMTIDGLSLAPFGQGSGLVGLPGDFTPPSRFVRAAIFCATATPSETSQEAIFQAFHILNQFDIPVGVARQKEGNVIKSDYTQITCVRDPRTLKYYFKTYEDPSIQYIDLTQFDYNGTAVKKAMTTSVGKAYNISDKLF